MIGGKAAAANPRYPMLQNNPYSQDPTKRHPNATYPKIDGVPIKKPR